MRIGRCFKIGYLVFIIISVAYLSSFSQEGEEREYADGVYEASNDMLEIAVSIKDGKIVDIKILEHRCGGEKYDEAVHALVDTIIQKQSTQVDAITAATVSSNALKDAIEKALEKAAIGIGKE